MKSFWFCRELFKLHKVYPLAYKREYIGAYIADLVVDNTLILELKSVEMLSNAMSAQVVNYLKLSGLEVGYLVNFHGIRVEWKRFVNATSSKPPE